MVEAVRSSWISSTGAFVQRFEREFAAMCSARAAVAVANGTAALHLAILALGVGAGDEVLVPSLTYVATANAVRYVGAEPIFVEIDEQTWCLDPARLVEAITPRTRGIIAVHLYGHPADMDAIQAVASAHGFWVIEDAAEAHLARYKGRVVGRLGTLGTFSFYGNKIFTSGEGGAVVVDDPALERRIRILRGQGMDPDRRYFFPITGYNYRMTNVASAILCAQLERAQELIARRRRVMDLYRQLLAGVPGLGFQPVAAWAEPAPWFFCVTVDERRFGMSRDALMEALDRAGIETRPFFIPLHRLPPFVEQSSRRDQELPITDRIASSGLNLPTHSQLRDDEVAYIADVIRRLRR